MIAAGALALLGGGGTVNSDSAVYLAPFPVLGDDAIPQGKLSAAEAKGRARARS